METLSLSVCTIATDKAGNNDLSAARNFAIEEASSEWILFLDEDEIPVDINPDYLHECLNNQNENIYYLQYSENLLSIEEQDLSVKLSVIKYNQSKTSQYLPIEFKIESTPENFTAYEYRYFRPFLFRKRTGIKFSGSDGQFLNIDNTSVKIKTINFNIKKEFYTKAAKDRKNEQQKQIFISAMSQPNLSISWLLYYESGLLAGKIGESDKNILRNEILEFNQRLLPHSGESYFYRFEPWFVLSINFLFEQHSDYLSAEAILIKVINIFPDSVNLLFQYYQVRLKKNEIYKCLSILKSITGIIRSEALIAKYNSPVMLKLFDPDYLNYLFALCYFELKDYVPFEHYIKKIKHLYKYEELIDNLLCSSNYEKKLCQITDKFPAKKTKINKPVNKIYDRYNLVKLINKNYLIGDMYDDNIALFRYCFEELGLEYTSSINELRQDYTNILFLPYVSTLVNNYIKFYSTIVWQTEQLAARNIYHPLSDDYLKALKDSTAIWDYSAANIKLLKSLGINNVSHLPFGFHEKLKVLDFNQEKTIDILFYGGLDPRRISILNSLSAKGFKVTALWNLFGEKRNSLIARAKIIINIHSFEMAMPEEHRLSFLLNNGCFVVSEKSSFPGENFSMDGIVFSQYDKLVETCEFYLKPENEHLRAEIAAKGYQKFSENKMVDNLFSPIKKVKRIIYYNKK
jgi:hypothetical protein